MKLLLIRLSSQYDDTEGLMYLNNRPECFTLEDEHRTKKVFGETRIPAGTYNIFLYTGGEKHKRYARKFPLIHKGMLLLEDVPGFTWILIHRGNDEEDTAGCILVGDGLKINVGRKGFLGESTQAYKRLYPKVAKALEAGEKVEITIMDYS